MRAGKIEQHNLGPRIVALAEEGLSTEEIAARLVSDGIAISQPTVARWLKKQREESRGKAEQIFSAHIDRELPKDLVALEEMERQCLSWAAEDVAGKAERISAWRMVQDNLETFAAKIREAATTDDRKERAGLITAIIKQVIGWLSEDSRQQRDRLAAMKQATGIIEVKLRNAGLLGDSEKGRIIIKPYDGSRPLDQAAEDQGGRRLFVVPGGGGKES